MNYIASYLLYTIYIQLFLSIISLPFLISWGLPISVLSLISTPLCTPVLILFLFLSSLVFFCELLFIPNEYPIFLLEKITDFWTFLFNKFQGIPLFGCKSPPLYILLLCPIFAFYITQKKTISLIKKTGILTLFLTLFLSVLFVTSLQIKELIPIPCNKKTIYIISAKNETILIDPGVIGSKASAGSWLSFELVPFLIKELGTVTIDHCILLRFSKRTIEAITAMLSKISIKKIYIPRWKGKIDSRSFRLFAQLKELCAHYGCTLVRLSSEPISIISQTEVSCNIEPIPKKRVSYGSAQFNDFCVHGTIDNNPFYFLCCNKIKQKKDSYDREKSSIRRCIRRIPTS